MTANQTFVQHLGRGLLFRDLTANEISYWADQIDKGFTTPVLLTFAATAESRFINENLPLATMYYVLYNTFPTIEEMFVWRKLLDTGASLEDIGTAFTNSNAFYSRFPTAANSTSEKIDALISASGVKTVSTDLRSEAISRIDSGDLQWGDALNYLVTLSGKHLTSGLALLWTTIKGLPPQLSEITALGTDAEEAVSQFYSVYGTVQSTLSGEGNDTIVGTTAAETLRGLGGDDTLSSLKGADTFIFEKDALTNGIDTITDFTIGKGGDILDFTLFLNKPNDTNLATVLSTSTAAKSWANGDVLVVSGNALIDSNAIAELFGTNKAFASPTLASKCVMITADIVGNATVWYIVNQSTTETIDASEITQVATLTGINNLALVGFSVDNIA